jgi:hypothetical protein
MGAKAGTKTPLAGQARVSQRLNSERAASAATNTDSYLDPVKVAAARKGNPTLDYLLSKERAAASAKNASQATISPLTDSDRAASAAREVEKSRKYGVPLTQTPPGGVDDYYTPDNRLPAPSPSDFGRRVFARRAFGRREVSPFF